MVHRPSLALLIVSAAAALAGFCVEGTSWRWMAAMGVAVFPVALMGLGAARGGRLGGVRWALLTVGVVFMGGLGTLLALPRGGPDVGGLPLGMWVMLGMVFVPFVLTCWAFVAGFSLRDEDLERLRRMKGPAGEG